MDNTLPLPVINFSCKPTKIPQTSMGSLHDSIQEISQPLYLSETMPILCGKSTWKICGKSHMGSVLTNKYTQNILIVSTYPDRNNVLVPCSLDCCF